MTERCVCCYEGHLLGKPIRVMSSTCMGSEGDGLYLLPEEYDLHSYCPIVRSP